ncbi:hypothetical protein [Nitrospirillum amazonense]|uniref:hypothetical protein n=1 Tax=Nitrospirillum amazonense TaxID=28077 RepID=UPI002412D70F|nr:hypothetical protein [Nitrospirillum amazonense]MDG3441363.1 hypothetical protein [Nitrospirillum amazonense]
MVEITENRTLDKIRIDINRVSMARLSLFSNSQIMADCYLVVNGTPTQAMTDAGKELHVKVYSLDKFERSLFDYKNYADERKKLQFGSAINPITGIPDKSQYVPVAYVRDGGGEVDIKYISKKLEDGKKIVLVGQYGAGKSRCIMELFSILSEKSKDRGTYYLAIDLRKAWGLQSAAEILRRHMEDIGLSSGADKLIRAFNAGKICFLLDGFDELGSQAWSNNATKLQNIRFETLAGVRELVERTPGGVLICGRDHYFNGNAELFRSIGVIESSSEIIYCKDEFSEDEMEDFLENLGIDVPVPDWLPKRPLMCQAIANLDSSELLSMFGDVDGDVLFWHNFMKVVCTRESRIKSSLDPETIYLVLKELSRMTRTKSAGVGPLTLSEIQRAFEAILGREPVEGASVMLQRLPGLGRTEAESDDRKFIDIYIVDGLRAVDVADSINEDRKPTLKERWLNPLGVLGQRVLGERVNSNLRIQTCVRYAMRAASEGNAVLASDIVSSSLRCGVQNIDFMNTVIEDGHILQLDLSASIPDKLTIINSIIEEIIFPPRPINGITISKSLMGKAFGVSSAVGLPSWVDSCDVSKFDSVANIAGVKNVRLSIPHRILVTILKKTYFQKGKGRQEEALLRGLGQIDRGGYTIKILSHLVVNGVLSQSRGDHGVLYIPVMKMKPRVSKIMSELNMSTDPIWQFTSDLIR